MKEKISEIRSLIWECRKYTGDKLQSFAVRDAGPYWPVLRRYVKLILAVEDLLNYVDELTGIIEEIDAKEKEVMA